MNNGYKLYSNFSSENDNFLHIIKKYANNFTNVSDEMILDILSNLELKTVNKGEILTNTNSTANYMYFILNGGVKSFCINEKEEIFNFYFSGEFAGDYFNFVNQGKSDFNIQALTRTDLLLLNFNNYKKYYTKYPEAKDLYYKILGMKYSDLKSRLINIISNTPEKNYLNLLKNHPYIFEIAQMKDIASYLGIAPQSLSRIRKKYNKK